MNNSSDRDELCDRLKLLLQEKQAGNYSDISNQHMVVIVDKLLEYKCRSKKQHKQLFFKCNLLREKVFTVIDIELKHLIKNE